MLGCFGFVWALPFCGNRKQQNNVAIANIKKLFFFIGVNLLMVKIMVEKQLTDVGKF
jgi:hypothetical protein